MPDILFTPAQRRAAIEALGLDPDLTISISVGPDWASATVADTTSDGSLRMTDGQLAVRTLSGPVADPPTPAEPDTTPADQPTA